MDGRNMKPQSTTPISGLPHRSFGRSLLVLIATVALAATAPSYLLAADELPARLIDPKQVEPVTTDEFLQVVDHHKGKVIVVNLWATWCIPCIQELPDLSLLQERYADRGVVVLAVSMDDPEKLDDKVRPFFAEKAPKLVSYLQTAEDEFSFVEPFDPEWIGALPTSFFIDKKGDVAEIHNGRILYKDLERIALDLLGGK